MYALCTTDAARVRSVRNACCEEKKEKERPVFSTHVDVVIHVVRRSEKKTATTQMSNVNHDRR